MTPSRVRNVCNVSRIVISSVCRLGVAVCRVDAAGARDSSMGWRLWTGAPRRRPVAPGAPQATGERATPMDTTPSSTPALTPSLTKRALVLAGGGAAGNAWELGLIAGLADAGVDVTEGDLIIGTSAGSTVAAQITSGTRPAELYAAILAEVPRPPAGDAGSDRGRAPNLSGPTYMEWSNGIIGSAENASDMRRRMGAAALEMDASDGSGQTRWRDIVAARLPSQHWPQQLVLIAAVDAQTGEPVVF